MFLVESNSKRTQAKEIYMLSQLTLKHFIKQMQLQKYRQLSLNSFFVISVNILSQPFDAPLQTHTHLSQNHTVEFVDIIYCQDRWFSIPKHTKQFHGNIMLKRFSKWDNNLLTPNCIINRTRSKWQKANVFHQEVLQAGCHV